MSARVTEEVIRWGLRFCSRRFFWQHRSFLTTPIKDRFLHNVPLAHVLGTRQTQTCVTSNLSSSVRFYTKEKAHSEDPKDKEHLSSPIQSDDPSLKQPQRTYPFIDTLQHCTSPSDVLDLTHQYKLTPRLMSNCLSHMWSCTKKMSEDQRRYELQLMFEHPEFEQLLQKAMRSVSHFSSEGLAYSVLSMVKLGVPQRSRVVQTFLRSCQERLNDFDEKALSILASCLESMKDSPNVSALKDGMRLIVEVRLPEIQSVMPLQTMMRVVGKDAPLGLKRKLEAKALSMKDQFSLPNSQHMIHTMAAMGFYSKPLLEVCTMKIRENLDSIPFSRLFKVLMSCRDLGYRDSDLFTDISHFMSSVVYMWTNKQMILFLFMFESLGFCPEAMMEAFAEKVIKDPDALTLKDLLCVLKVYSSLNFDLQQQSQPFLNSLTSVLESYLPKMSTIELSKALFSLCLFGHFPSAPLELFLQDSSLEQLKTAPAKFLQKQDTFLRMMDLCLRLDRPSLRQPLTDLSSVLGESRQDPTPINPLLSQSLRDMLGEQADGLLQEGVIVENFYFIDAVITKTTLNQTSVAAESGPDREEGSAESRPDREEGSAESRPDREESSAESRPDREEGSAESRPDREESSAESRPDREESSAESRPDREEGSAESRPDREESSAESGPDSEQSSPVESSQRIAVVCASPSAFCFGTRHPRGNLALKIRHLRILGYNTILLAEKELQSLSQEERTEFLREQIFPEHRGSEKQPETEQLGS
ncbi:FAST kinase domain-containing protein 2, mitochondrial isoform X2 [Cheilinus undulatus]|uniref:FAST kinase domain-containing protein 2, mitochondrial isoform X2 n=1 Tax=Cheilinus undulatus TaxID=241271 RepID=UPI001BD3B965|nr:FAST kinase domain-containing protein 2, mitochondrial isoform X2 [Cheilinus undulatus]